MEINIFEAIKKESVLCAEKLRETLCGISKLTEAYVNALPQTGLMEKADETAKKKSVARHYKFAQALGERLTVMGEQRTALLCLSEKLDELSSKVEFEELENISVTGRYLFELMKKIEEIESTSGRFLNGLDRFADTAGKGENADFRSVARLCREYFEFVANAATYIDNLKFF